jgi:hypothetical protein
MKSFLAVCALLFVNNAMSQTPSSLQKKVNEQSAQIEKKVINWRRHIHQNPELSNREVKTAQYVAGHLKSL